MSAKSFKKWRTHCWLGRAKLGAAGISSTGRLEHVCCASYARGFMLEVTTAGSCCASYLLSTQRGTACWLACMFTTALGQSISLTQQCKIELQALGQSAVHELVCGLPDSAQVFFCTVRWPTVKVRLTRHRQRPVDAVLSQVLCGFPVLLVILPILVITMARLLLQPSEELEDAPTRQYGRKSQR